MISVIIPTYNRSKILKRCLSNLEDQTLPKEKFEIIIIDDGSTDNTQETVKKIQKESSINLSYHKQKNKGQGSARNIGILKAKGEIIIFIGDDIFPKPNFLEEHFLTHKEHPEENAGVLGYTTWHPDVKITPFMHFLEHGGHQFAYDNLKNKKLANFYYFYTSNISLKKSILIKHNFDEDFKKYGWEDIELGYRLEKKENLQLYYNPKAVGFHFHEIKETDFRKHMHRVGSSALTFHKKHPELQKPPSLWKYYLIKIATNPIAVKTARLINKNIHYKLLTKKYFMEGFQEAIANSNKLK